MTTKVAGARLTARAGLASRPKVRGRVNPSPPFSGSLVWRAISESFLELAPRRLLRRPARLLLAMGVGFTLMSFVHALVTGNGARFAFLLGVATFLCLTVLLLSFAEAMAGARSKARARTLENTQKDVLAKRLEKASPSARFEQVSSRRLRRGELCLVEAGETIPGDGEVVQGVASVDESAITGASASVIREGGTVQSAVTGGTVVLSGWLIVRITANPGENFLDRTIASLEGAEHHETPKEMVLDVVLFCVAIALSVSTLALFAYSTYIARASDQSAPISLAMLVTLLVCLSPAVVAGLVSATGIAAVDRLVDAKLIPTPRALDALGEVDVLLLQKTGTVTLGCRRATEFVAARGVSATELARAVQLASHADPTPEGRSIVELAKERYACPDQTHLGARVVRFSRETRISGVDLDGREIRKGAVDAIQKYRQESFGHRENAPLPRDVRAVVEDIATSCGTPLVVADGTRILGVVHLADTLQAGIHEKCAELRRAGIKTVMLTGDNPLSAATMAAAAGIDDFLAEATPEATIARIREYQRRGHRVAMTGNATSDAAAMAQADVALAMNDETRAARDAGNVVALDSNPTKLVQALEIGRQTRLTRISLAAFGIASDLGKYLAIVPAVFAGVHPSLAALNVLRLHSPSSAILAAVIYNALGLIALTPVALRGIARRHVGAPLPLRRNMLGFGLAGILVPFPFLKLIDMLLVGVGLV